MLRLCVLLLVTTAVLGVARQGTVPSISQLVARHSAEELDARKSPNQGWFGDYVETRGRSGSPSGRNRRWLLRQSPSGDLSGSAGSGNLPLLHREMRGAPQRGAYSSYPIYTSLDPTQSSMHAADLGLLIHPQRPSIAALLMFPLRLLMYSFFREVSGCFGNWKCFPVSRSLPKRVQETYKYAEWTLVTPSSAVPHLSPHPPLLPQHPMEPMHDDDSVFSNGKSLGSYANVSQLVLTQAVDVSNISLFADVTSTIHGDIKLSFYYKSGATAPRSTDIDIVVNRVLQNAVNRDNAKPCYNSTISHVGDMTPGKPIPAWEDGKINPCMTVFIEPTEDDTYWPQNRLRFLTIDWEIIKGSFNFNNVFKLPRFPKAEWDAGAESHWIAYMGIPIELWNVDAAGLFKHFTELADEWNATPYAETRGRQTSVFFKFDTEEDLVETLKTKITEIAINGVTFPATSSHVDYIRVLVLGHIANIPDLAGKYTEWWLKQAKARLPVCLFLARCGVKEEDLPQVVTPIAPLSGSVDMCFLTFKTATAAANCYQKLGWDVRGLTVLANGLGRAALFTYPTWVSNLKGYFDDRRAIKKLDNADPAANAPAAAVSGLAFSHQSFAPVAPRIPPAAAQAKTTGLKRPAGEQMAL